MTNFIIAAIIAVLLAAAVRFIIKEKKRGVKCIGCPAAGECAKKDQAAHQCSCGFHPEQ